MRAAPSNFLPLDREKRFQVEETIERLIAILDMQDGDPDREDDEPAEESDNGIADEGARQLYDGERDAIMAFYGERWDGDRRPLRQVKRQLREVRKRRRAT